MANDQNFKIKYKSSNDVICIENICMYMTFILVEDAGPEVLLGIFLLHY